MELKCLRWELKQHCQSARKCRRRVEIAQGCATICNTMMTEIQRVGIHAGYFMEPDEHIRFYDSS